MNIQTRVSMCRLLLYMEEYPDFCKKCGIRDNSRYGSEIEKKGKDNIKKGCVNKTAQR